LPERLKVVTAVIFEAVAFVVDLLLLAFDPISVLAWVSVLAFANFEED